MRRSQTAVLVSAGLDSAVLAASFTDQATVHPIYVSAGLSWEAEELRALDRLLAAPPFNGSLRPLTRLAFRVDDLYPATHWALTGTPPAFDTPDEDVYLVGRNLMLLSKAGVHCARHGIGRIALGPLDGNPFPDAHPSFFEAMGRALSIGLAQPIEILTPFLGLSKADVIRMGMNLGVPLELTLSCMNPRDGRHCGRCSKCRERRDAFAAAGVPDRTDYASPPPR